MGTHHRKSKIQRIRAKSLLRGDRLVVPNHPNRRVKAIFVFRGRRPLFNSFGLRGDRPRIDVLVVDDFREKHIIRSFDPDDFVTIVRPSNSKKYETLRRDRRQYLNTRLNYSHPRTY